jgi:uncharacterized membrane protein YqaE (UPF0057 family)
LSKVVLIVLAILLPPLAVYLKTKSAKDTIINLLLCFLFWIPGILHALYLILKQALASVPELTRMTARSWRVHPCPQARRLLAQALGL